MGAHVWIADGLKNFSDTTAWDVGTVPATTDSVTFNSTHVGGCTVDAVGTWSGGSLTISAGYTGTITNGVAFSVGLFNQGAGTFTDNAGITMTRFQVSAGTYNAYSGTTTINATVLAISFSGTAAFNANGGTLLVGGASGTVSVTNTAGVTVNLLSWNRSGGLLTFSTGTWPLGANPSTVGDVQFIGAAAVVSGSGVWSNTGRITQTTGTISGFSGINITEGLWDGNGTIPSGMNLTLTFTSATTRTCNFRSKNTYGLIYRTGSGSGQLSIGTPFTSCTEFRDNGGLVAHTIAFNATSTFTASAWTLAGAVGKVLTIISLSPGSAGILHSVGGATIGCDYLSVTDNTVDASPAWYAGTNSTLVSNTTNWLTGDPPATPPPNAPTNLAAVAGDAQVSLSWTAATGSPTSYSVKRGTAPGTEVLLQSLGLVTSYLDTSVINGTTYYYVVSASNAGGESGNSNEVSATPTAVVPPVIVTVAGGSWPYAKDYIHRTREQYRRLEEDEQKRKRLKADEESVIRKLLLMLFDDL